MTLKSDLIEKVRRLEWLFWRIQTYPFETFDEAVYSTFKERVSSFLSQAISLRDSVLSAPFPVRFHVITAKQTEGISYYWLQWKVGQILHYGFDYANHPFIGLTLEEAADLLVNMAKRLAEIVERKWAMIVGVLVVYIDNFSFVLYEDWYYTVYVKTPLEWLKPWEIDKWGKSYSVKHRTLIFLATMEIADLHIAGYTFVPLTPEEIEARKTYGRILKRWRTKKLDPEDLISVELIERGADYLIWKVDLGRISDRIEYPPRFSKEKFKQIVRRADRLYRIEFFRIVRR